MHDVNDLISASSNERDRLSSHPYDRRGRFIKRQCALCGCGILRYAGGGLWECDGLIDPDDDNKPLEPCPNYHINGNRLI